VVLRQGLLVLKAPRRDSACQTGFQGSEIEPAQPNGVRTQRATILVIFEM
jgi:hypothetical protein